MTGSAVAGEAGIRLAGRTVLIAFALIVGGLLALAVIGAVVGEAPKPPPICEPGLDCGGPPVSSPAPGGVAQPSGQPPAGPADVGIRAGKVWKSETLDVEFEYDPEWWSVREETDSRVEFDYHWSDSPGVQLIVDIVPASEARPQALADRWLTDRRGWAPDLKLDHRGRNAVLGAEIGFVDGIGLSYAGSHSSIFGGVTPVGITIVTAGDGRNSAAVVLTVPDPDKLFDFSDPPKWRQYYVRQDVELLLKTFRWGPVS